MGSLILQARNDEPFNTPRLDNLAIVYIVLNVFWTAVVLIASVTLWKLRRQESISKRNVGLTISAVLCLQIYWSLNMILFPLHGAYPCDLNFWVMSIYFPLGIALFQLQNVQLLSVSARQKDLRQQPFRASDRLTIRHFQFWNYHRSWKQMTLLSKIYFGIFVCVITQIVLSSAVFFVSRKFVAFGVTGRPNPSPSRCTHGWQWVVTILYQAIWTYIFGPWLLWRIRKINDIFHWRLQTVLAIVFSLPGLPMWLVATEVPTWAPVTAKFPNGCWYNPGICVMQGVALFFPLYEVIRAKRRQVQNGLGSEMTLQQSSDTDIESQIKGSKHSMRAFEEALQNASDELLEYASTREFTGENIIFLNNVRDFKANWSSTSQDNDQISVEQRQKYFSIATDIYDRCISLETAQFPINIDGHLYHFFTDMFGRNVVASSSVVTPFADRWSVATIAALYRTSDKYTTNNKPFRPGPIPNPDASNGYQGNTSSEFILATTANSVPENFNISVFDGAERSVKHMVFTNTWMRYVESWRHSQSTLSSGSYQPFDPSSIGGPKGQAAKT